MRNRLKVLRAEHDWSQGDLADRLGVSRQTVNAIETGKYDPSLPLAFRMARLFGKSIEDIFDAVRNANGFSRARYDIYGHSAGAQFLHRLVLFKPAARYRVAVAANAGWYAMPDFAVSYPYGLGASGLSPAGLARAFGRHLVLLLGDRLGLLRHLQRSRLPDHVLVDVDGPRQLVQDNGLNKFTVRPFPWPSQRTSPAARKRSPGWFQTADKRSDR